MASVRKLKFLQILFKCKWPHVASDHHIGHRSAVYDLVAQRPVKIYINMHKLSCYCAGNCLINYISC